MNIKNMLRLLAVITIAVIGMGAVCLSAAATATISIDDASADSGLTSTTPIRISDLTETVGAIEVVLTYDADVEVVSVTPGSMGTITPGI
ncbi:MAG: cohesin domain-containing protein, partial [ANME-2 cluster archaeon]|nr:cohesin domain-containing protein [ANME-2 cluster archaeon]